MIDQKIKDHYDVVSLSLGHIQEHQALLDNKIDTANSENDELVPSFNFVVYKIEINRRLKKQMDKSMEKKKRMDKKIFATATS